LRKKVVVAVAVAAVVVAVGDQQFYLKNF